MQSIIALYFWNFLVKIYIVNIYIDNLKHGINLMVFLTSLFHDCAHCW